MIPKIVEFVVSLGFGFFIWYHLQDIVNWFIDKMVTRYPTVYDASVVVFSRAIVHFSIFFFLVGISYSIIVYAQRKSPEGYY